MNNIVSIDLFLYLFIRTMNQSDRMKYLLYLEALAQYFTILNDFLKILIESSKT